MSVSTVNIAALVLAAGISRRMGRNKLLLEFGEKTIIEKTLENILASQVNTVTVTLGHMKEEMARILAPYADAGSITLAENPFYPEGMGSTVRVGVKRVLEKGTYDAIMFFNGDMPFIRPQTIDALIETYVRQDAAIVVPCFQGRRGNPVLFGKKFFRELLEASGDVGARELLQKHAAEVVWLEVADPGIHEDIDCPEDYQRLKNNRQ
ncbi:MAG: molybdenum cofactor cytidylyltransferase [Clostridia bacterium]|jgi:molybdenum cofactor cytidylyltransferase|nr:molybdenum cofactor cytidylyltransferase [Clostridia bacterium]